VQLYYSDTVQGALSLDPVAGRVGLETWEALDLILGTNGIIRMIVKSDGKIGNLRNLISTFAPFDAQDYIKTANAQQLSSFVKDFFVADLKGMPGGSKLNQLIEKKLIKFESDLNILETKDKTFYTNNDITLRSQLKDSILKLKTEIKDIEYEVRLKTIEGSIESSLYESAVEQNVDIRAIIELADVFAWTIDFAMGIRGRVGYL